MHPIFPPFLHLLFSTPLTVCHLCTLSLCFLLVFISVALSFLFDACHFIHCPPPYLYAFAYSFSPLFYAYLIIYAGHFIQAFAHLTLITPVMPLDLTLFMLLLQSYLSLYFSSVLSSIKLLCYSVGSLYSCSGTSH